MADECKHEYVHSRTDSFSYPSGRNHSTWKEIDTFHCKFCLHEREVVKTHTDQHDNFYGLPDWAKKIK